MVALTVLLLVIQSIAAVSGMRNKDSAMIAQITNQNTMQTNRDDLLDALAAELTDAAYPIALRYRDSGSSLDLELEISRWLSPNGSAAGGRSCSPAPCRDSRETFAPADAEGVLSESTGGRISRRKAMWIVRMALRHTYTFVVVAMMIAVLGAVSVYRMSTDIFPSVNIPVVSVVWQYTGMPADQIETRIILVNERVLTASVNGIEHIESQSLDGVGVIRIYF